MVKQKCKLCGHEWISRKVVPMACPRCKRYDYKIGVSSKKPDMPYIYNLTALSMRPECLGLNYDDEVGGVSADTHLIPDEEMSPSTKYEMYEARKELVELQSRFPDMPIDIPDWDTIEKNFKNANQ